jgi:FdrA protein
VNVAGVVRRRTYRDSIEMMRLARTLEALPGVLRAAALMGTRANLLVLADAGLCFAGAADATAEDLVVAVAADGEPTTRAALEVADSFLAGGGASAAEAGLGNRPVPVPSLAAAAAELGGGLAIVSTAGPFAAAEALKALKCGLDVFLFSDNVALADEVALKREAARRGRLVMGPDCGTAIVGGVPLGFANAVRPGSVGLVGASGTGLQEVTCLIDRLGGGISHAIGVGGRDLDERVGGTMMLAALARLAADAGTRVIVLISKPPAPAVARRVLEAAA